MAMRNRLKTRNELSLQSGKKPIQAAESFHSLDMRVGLRGRYLCLTDKVCLGFRIILVILEESQQDLRFPREMLPKGARLGTPVDTTQHKQPSTGAVRPRQVCRG